MSKKSPSSITNLWILSGIIVAAAAALYWKFGPAVSSSPRKQNLFYQDLTSFARTLEERWQEGDIENAYQAGKFSCPELVENGHRIDAAYFQCNPFYLLCFLEGRAGVEVPDKFKLEEYSFRRRGKLALKIRHAASGQTANIELADSCRNILLPSSVYSAGPQEDGLMLWDNHGQKIYLDKHYVSNADIEVWKRFLGEKNGVPASEFHKPATALSLEEKKSYCEFRGGQLMQSRYFDAAVFLPSVAANGYIYKFPYPWTKRKDALRGKGKECEKIFTKECVSEGYVFHASYSPSWSGVYHALGSYEEVFVNKFHPPANVKPSSMLLPLDSPWHKLGLRSSLDWPADLAGYNGVSLERPRAPANKKRRAFRCVHYR